MNPVVAWQYASMGGEVIERHVFPDGDAFIAWLDSQETTVFLEVQPRDEVL